MENRLSMPVSGIEYRKKNGKVVLSGYAAVFGEMSHDLGGFREKIAPGAFRKSIEGGADVKALVDHDPSRILGRTRADTLSVVEDAKGLRIEINPADTQAGRDIMVSIERGDVDQMSFAFRTIEDEWDHSDPNESIRTLKEVDLRDVSVVTDPAYPQTAVKLARRDFESAKREARATFAVARLDKALEAGNNTPSAA